MQWGRFGLKSWLNQRRKKGTWWDLIGLLPIKYGQSIQPLIQSLTLPIKLLGTKAKDIINYGKGVGAIGLN